MDGSVDNSHMIHKAVGMGQARIVVVVVLVPSPVLGHGCAPQDDWSLGLYFASAVKVAYRSWSQSGTSQRFSDAVCVSSQNAIVEVVSR